MNIGGVWSVVVAHVQGHIDPKTMREREAAIVRSEILRDAFIGEFHLSYDRMTRIIGTK